MRPLGFVLLLGSLRVPGCGPTATEIAGAVLLYTPIVYLLALWIVWELYRMWRSALPDLRFGRNSHIAALVVLVAVAFFGAWYADAGLFWGVLWFFGSCVLGWWLLLARLTVRSGWGFRWGGLVVTGLLATPMLLALLLPQSAPNLTDAAVAIYLYTSAVGLVPALFLIFMLIEAARAVRVARAAEVADIPGPNTMLGSESKIADETHRRRS